ncbi:pectinesterase family protein [Bacillus sp. 3255]|uniref:pectinesterase family protein n=1 Tax=Bacillus sp. 3255 TaxID=2817904 RepID=UPI00285BD9B8|nr:pectinesterase family protein [Bacillus sp. 3255]MDR6881853.1 pectin methylesterase-like acyl-CoA thioesterase [Bacillus sp. 3255]
MDKRLQSCISKLMVFLMLSTTLLGIGSSTVLAIDTTNTRSFDVWDFGGAEAPEEAYVNQITVSLLNGLTDYVSTGGSPAKGVFKANTPFGDLTLFTSGTHNRLYYYDGSANGALSYGNPTSKTFSDGYVSKGSIYSAGNGDDTTKYIKLDNVVAGDTITLYGFVTNGTGTSNVNFDLTSTSNGTTKKGTDTVDQNGKKVTYLAKDSGSLKIYFTNSTASVKPNIARIVRTPGVKVSGMLNLNGYAISGHSLVFQNESTGDILKATLDPDGTYEATLNADYTYTAVLQGVNSEYSISDTTKTLITSTAQIVSGINDHHLDVAQTPMSTVSGSIAGFDSGYNLDHFKITFNPPEGSLAPAVEADLNKASMTYSVDVRAGVAYSTVLSGVNDYELTGGSSVHTSTNMTQDITVAKKAVYMATGAFVGLPPTVAVSSMTFTNVDDGYSYPGTVTGSGNGIDGGYTVSLRDGAYAVSATSTDPTYSTIGHVVVSGSSVTKNVKFSTTTPLSALPWVGDLYVGDSTKANYFTTIREALATAARMNPASEAQRITIHIAPGVYREQLKVTTPYISFVNTDPSKEVKITWYYGVGYDYYSAGPDGSYNEDRAFDKYAKGYPGNFKWGATVFLTSAAKGFRAESIVFENSFNKYVTQEELDDGVQVTTISTPTNLTVRTMGMDATSRAATERAAAVGVEADNVEFYNSKFLSSQDTLYTGNSVTNQYYKDCFIEGNTDYIFGDGNAVFDNCILNFTGYSDTGSGGYITAAKPSAASNPQFFGYLFKGATITGTQGKIQAPGYFGRPWGQEAKVKFLDTRLQDSSLIAPQGWTSMSNSTPENASFYEYNTTYNGQPVDTSSRRGYVLTADTAVTNVTDYLGSDWLPKYYTPGATAPVITAYAGNGNATLTWTTVTGATYYTVKGRTADSTVYNMVYSVDNPTVTSYTYSGLMNGTAYQFIVTASDSYGGSVNSNVVTVTPGVSGTAPSAPSIDAIAGGASAKLTWNAVPGATSYQIKGGTSSGVYPMVQTVNDATITSYTYSGLTYGTTYNFVVTASNEYGESAASNIVSVTPGSHARIKPEDFMGADVGSPALAGSSSFDDDTNVFTLTGSGTGINKNATGLDQFYLKAVKIKGDYTISAKAAFVGYGPGIYGNPGLTIRESLDPNSYHFTQLEQYASTAVGGRKMFRYNGSSNGSNNNFPLNGTAYLQLTKVGDKITSIISSSPIPKEPIASDSLIISSATATNLGLDANGNPKELYVGLLATSANASKRITATFEDVRIVMADGTVAFDSNEGKPVAPKNVAAKPYDASALITWDALPTATSYTVKQSANPQGPFTIAKTVTDSTYQAEIKGLANEQTHYFVVTASNASGESIPSAIVSVVPTASASVPPVITMTSAEPASQVYSALLPISGKVNKQSTLTITNNGVPVKLAGEQTSLHVKKDEPFNATLILLPGMNEIEIKAADDYGYVTTTNYQVTYTYKATTINFYDDNGQVVTKLAPGKDIVVMGQVDNFIAPTKDAVMFTGLYDEHNNLIKFISTAETVANGDAEQFAARMKLPDDVSGYTLKVFIWDHVVHMQPVSDVIELK